LARAVAPLMTLSLLLRLLDGRVCTERCCGT
jgi:hypothetical protein